MSVRDAGADEGVRAPSYSFPINAGTTPAINHEKKGINTMQVKDIMSQNPACCTKGASLEDVAKLMVDFDCGVIPVVDDAQNMLLLGVITDRDIVCRTIAKGINPLNEKAGDYMSSPVVIARTGMDLRECIDNMEHYQIRRVIVVDDTDRCCGVLSQADLAKAAEEHDAAEVLKEVSKPTGAPSQVGRKS